MKKIFARTASLVVALSALSGCVDEMTDPLDCPISFASSIDGLDNDTRTPSASGALRALQTTHARQTTRAANTDWHHDDAIGIYMVGTGGRVADDPFNTNALHRHAGEGNFNAAPGHELFYPRVGMVDFVAYYPWRPTYDDHRYPIYVADQSDHPAIDFMYSNNAARHSAGDVPMLEFHHMLSKLIFNVRDLTGTPLDSLSAVITGLRTRGIFHLSEGTLSLTEGSSAGIAPAPTDDGDDDPSTARLEAIVLPDTGIAPVILFGLDEGVAAPLPLDDDNYRSGKVYIYSVTITAGGEVTLGGSVIIDWDDMDRDPGEYLVPKTDPNDPGDPDDPDDPKTRYFSEGFGDGGSGDGGTLDARPKIDDYTGWDSDAPVEFADRFGGADVRRAGNLDAHVWFPPGTDADFTITGLPAGWSEITLGYDITSSGAGGVRASSIRVYAGEENVTSHVTAIIPSPNRYTRISIDIPPGVTSLRFVSDASVNIHGMRLDNITLEGRK